MKHLLIYEEDKVRSFDNYVTLLYNKSKKI